MARAQARPGFKSSNLHSAHRIHWARGGDFPAVTGGFIAGMSDLYRRNWQLRNRKYGLRLFKSGSRNYAQRSRPEKLDFREQSVPGNFEIKSRKSPNPVTVKTKVRIWIFKIPKTKLRARAMLRGNPNFRKTTRFCEFRNKAH